MKPILFKGHSRPVRCVTYNQDGDLLFTCGVDKMINGLFADSGIRFGTYTGHIGSVSTIDPSYRSERLLSASADETCKIWDITTGKELATFDHRAPVFCASWALGENLFVSSTRSYPSSPGGMYIWDCSPELIEKHTKNPKEAPVLKESKLKLVFKDDIHCVRFDSYNKHLIAATSKGQILVIDPEKGKIVKSVLAHKGVIKNFKFGKRGINFITASKDHTAKLFDTKDCELLKTYTAEKPVNDAAISPTEDRVILGGGQEAVTVATTETSGANFETRFYHKIYESFIGSVAGHFSPVNSLCFSPNGKSFVTAGEDGYCRINHLHEKT